MDNGYGKLVEFAMGAIVSGSVIAISCGSADANSELSPFEKMKQIQTQSLDGKISLDEFKRQIKESKVISQDVKGCSNLWGLC